MNFYLASIHNRQIQSVTEEIRIKVKKEFFPYVKEESQTVYIRGTKTQIKWVRNAMLKKGKNTDRCFHGFLTKEYGSYIFLLEDSRSTLREKGYSEQEINEDFDWEFEFEHSKDRLSIDENGRARLHKGSEPYVNRAYC